MQFLADGETYVWSCENCGYLGQGREAKASRHTIPLKHTFPCIHVFYTFLQHWSHLQDVKWPFEKGINGSHFHLSICPEPIALTICQYSTSRVQFLCLNPGNASLIQENQDIVIIVCLSALFTKELLGKRTEKNHAWWDMPKEKPESICFLSLEPILCVKSQRKPEQKAEGSV